MTTRVYKYDIQTTIKEDVDTERCRKKYIFTFIVEFEWNNVAEWLEKAKCYLNQGDKLHFVEKEDDGNYYIYLRKRKYKLESEVNIV